MTTKRKKPETKAGWAAERIRINCKIALDILDGKNQPPEGATNEEWLFTFIDEAHKDATELLELKGTK